MDLILKYNAGTSSVLGKKHAQHKGENKMAPSEKVRKSLHLI